MENSVAIVVEIREETVGERVRRLRLRAGKSQTEVGTALGHSQAWQSKVENGKIELDSVRDINRLANILHCHPNDFLGRPYPASALDNAWQRDAQIIVREMRRYDLRPTFEDVPRPTAELWPQVIELSRLRARADSAAILARIPDLLAESRALADGASGHEREQAYAVYAHACKAAHGAAHALGHPELVAMSCERLGWAASLSGEAVGGTVQALASHTRAWDMWNAADWDDSVQLLDNAVQDIDAAYRSGEPLALRMTGSMYLRSAIGSARGGDSDRAQERISYAREAVDRLNAYNGDPYQDPDDLAFSLGNVLIHGASAAVEAGDHTMALDLNDQAKREHPEALASLPKSRIGHHKMDMARAHLRNGNRDKALVLLESAERTAPQLVRNHPIARATLRSILYIDRTTTRERLRSLSTRFHLQEQ